MTSPEERSAVALVNYVLCAPVEAVQIARLRVGQITSCPGDDSSMTSMEGDESWVSDAPVQTHLQILTVRWERRAKSQWE